MTTGQPIKYPSDRNKYKNEFNQALQLQIDLNQKNLEVNRLYKETGQLPASTQMQDTRSNEEKLADIEGLKRSIASDLAPVAEPAFASAVIQGVLDSPLNVNNSLFRYLAQNASSFAQSLGKKYKFGIAGDANDVEVMVQFLEDAYNKTKNSFQSIKGYIDSNTNQGIRSKSNTLSANDTDNVKAELKDAQKRITYNLNQIDLSGIRLPVIVEENLGTMLRMINLIDNFIPTTEQLNVIINDLSNAIRRDVDMEDEVALLTFEILKELPRLASIQTLIDSLEKAIKNHDTSIIIQCVKKFEMLFASFFTTRNMNILTEFHSHYINKARDKLNRDTYLNRIHTIEDINRANLDEENRVHAQRVYVINPSNDPAKIAQYDNMGNYIGPNNDQGSVYSRDVHSIQSADFNPPGIPYVRPGGDDGSVYSDIAHSIQSADFNPPGVDYIPPLQPAVYAGPPTQQEREYIHRAYQIVANAEDRNDAVNRIAELDNDVAYVHTVRPQYRHPLSNKYQQLAGNGLKRVKKGRGISTKYSPFGVHEINHKNLEKGIFTMRRKTKSNIMGLPSKHVSKHFQNIIHNIMGGKIADFNDIHNLSDDEKNYLHKIISKSDLQDRLSVPAPSKDQQEKDFHNFEVMKGEILAGNDSKELVKNFKVLTMKLTRQHLLPKNEVMELMEDLLTLGY